MDTSAIIAALDAEIARLTQARALLAGGTGKRRGRPPKNADMPAWVTSNSLTPAATVPAQAPARKKRTFTAQQRKEQSERAKRMWAERKKATAKKPAKKAAKKSSAKAA